MSKFITSVLWDLCKSVTQKCAIITTAFASASNDISTFWSQTRQGLIPFSQWAQTPQTSSECFYWMASWSHQSPPQNWSAASSLLSYPSARWWTADFATSTTNSKKNRYHSPMKINRQAGRQTDRQTDRQIDR